ncbi:MAG: D-alanyl-D-alanine carboxypeptidase/D-alanyl-D-alanine-endopeptidase [Bacteroidales bacterium]|nr:D-alanyl-D-alanine carboxypeptidase/D-alanyl-D-alanine-endopeptidase [Bacteroidales bacterium]
MRKLILLLALLLSLAASAQPRSAVRTRLDSIAALEPLRSSVLGVLAVRMNGDTLADLASTTRLVPASNVKLLTTGLALHVLGPDFRYETRLCSRGDMLDGVLHGDLYIVGTGDPTLAAGYAENIPADSLFADWKRILERAGVREITGRIIGDDRWFDGEAMNGDWSLEDLGAYYGSSPTGLNFFENIQTVSVAPADTLGLPVLAEAVYPPAPWLNLQVRAKTWRKGTGDGLSYFNTPLSPYAELRGTYAIDNRPKTLECSNRFAAYSCAQLFHDFLNENGLAVRGGYADLDAAEMIRTDLEFTERLEAAAPVSSLTILGSTWSDRLSRIVTRANHDSDNFYAETLLRTLGKQIRGSASFDSCYVALDDAFATLGIRSAGQVQLRDGSGLSRKDFVSPAFFVEFLRRMMAAPEGDLFLHSLPQPGKGTLQLRMQKAPRSTKDRIYMKSGSMNGVRCFSGYILSPSGRPEETVVFSILVNNISRGASTALSLIDSMILTLAE